MKSQGKITSRARFILVCLAAFLPLGCGEDGVDNDGHHDRGTVVVNSLLDLADPPAGVVTLRSALAAVRPGGRVVFAPELDGGVIRLTVAGEEHSILPAETYAANQFVGYTGKDHGRSALYLTKDLTIDASDLARGITLRWEGVEPARVLAVYGDLTLRNVTITGGHSAAETLANPDQPFTLARGGGLATWGKTELDHCVIHDNLADGDPNSSRDRGAFGGGVYGNLLIISDSVISGNQARGYGAAGGGVYAVGGAHLGRVESRIERSALTGNRTTAHHSYGGGVFSGGGGPGNNLRMVLENSTLARNLVEDNPAIPLPAQYYYRGGGFYMTNGSAAFLNCTIAENEVVGTTAVFSGKPNVGGGGVAATIGSAHVVENMEFKHSIVAANRVNGAGQDVFSGSLLNFYSYGYNVFGELDFDYILVPIPPWWSLSRKHYPKTGDADGLSPMRALDLGAVERHPEILSRGTDAGERAVLWYPPGPAGLNRIPTDPYRETFIFAQYSVLPGWTDDFLARVVEKLRDDYGLGPGFGTALIYAGVTWTGDDFTWTSDPANADWIKFWRDLDQELGTALGTVRLGDAFWDTYATGPLGTNLQISVSRLTEEVVPAGRDQLGYPRPKEGAGDSGAIESREY